MTRRCAAVPVSGCAGEPGPATADRGFVTVAVLGLVLVLASVAAAIVMLGSVAVARHRAAAAADLAALSAAQHADEGPGPACLAATKVARGQDAELVACRLEGREALVEALVRPVGLLGGLGAAHAQARAGPWRR